MNRMAGKTKFYTPVDSELLVPRSLTVRLCGLKVQALATVSFGMTTKHKI